MRVVDDPVQNGVGGHSLSYLRVSSLRIVLRAEDGGGDRIGHVALFSTVYPLENIRRRIEIKVF